MTEMRGFVAEDMRRFLLILLILSLAYHGLAALPKRETRYAMSEIKIREEICRLGRSLFERGLTPGSSGNISVKLDDGGWLVTPTNASLGFLDPARLSRLDASGNSPPAMPRPR